MLGTFPYPCPVSVFASSEFCVSAPSPLPGGSDPVDSAADGLRVLIADGYADAADSLALLLALWGHDAAIARTGPETLHAARAHRPRVVLLEPALDGLDGYAVAGRLRQEHGEDMVLIALTALGDAAHRRRAREDGFDLFLVKPVEPARLERLLERLSRIPPGR